MLNIAINVATYEQALVIICYTITGENELGDVLSLVLAVMVE